MECIVRISEQAVISMALNGIEAYSVKHAAEGESRLETCGALFGYEVKLSKDRILYQMEMAKCEKGDGFIFHATAIYSYSFSSQINLAIRSNN